MNHIHHIIPKHVGGTDDITNLIELSIEEHAEAHRILWETHGLIEDKIAWQCLSGRKLSEEDRILLAKSGFEKFMNDEKRKSEWVEKIKSKRKLQFMTEEHRSKISNSLRLAYAEGRHSIQEYTEDDLRHMRETYYKNNMGKILSDARKKSEKWNESVRSEESRTKKRKSMKNSKRVTVNGIEYDSLRDAAKNSGFSYSQLRKILNSNSNNDIRYL